jgi:hypothetical protein
MDSASCGMAGNPERAWSCTVSAFARVCALALALGITPGCVPRSERLSDNAGSGAVPVVITNVNVVPMDSERVHQRQAILIRDGVIQQLGPGAASPTSEPAFIASKCLTSGRHRSRR